jgi:hypothetical protein
MQRSRTASLRRGKRHADGSVRGTSIGNADISFASACIACSKSVAAHRRTNHCVQCMQTGSPVMNPSRKIDTACALAAALLAIIVPAPSARATTMADQVLLDSFEAHDYCPPGRIVTTKVGWRYDGGGTGQIDVTQAKNIWGRDLLASTPIEMPWLQEFAIFWNYPRGSYYLASQFTLPDNLPLNQHGLFTHAETLSGPPIDTAISETCGDFYSSGPKCVTEDVGVGHTFGAWHVDTMSANSCTLHAGTTYYLNVRLTDPDVDSPQCGISSCVLNIQTNHTP